MAGTVARVGESGIVYIGKHGARYALLTDFVRRADWAGVEETAHAPAPEPARGVAAPETGKDTGEAPNAPEGQEMASGVYGPVLVPDPETGLPVHPGVTEARELRLRVEALTRERDEARQKLKTMMLAAVALIETAKEVFGE